MKFKRSVCHREGGRKAGRPLRRRAGLGAPRAGQTLPGASLWKARGGRRGSARGGPEPACPRLLAFTVAAPRCEGRESGLRAGAAVNGRAARGGAGPRPGADAARSRCVLQIFEWWYFRKYGTSFIEQVSVSHLRPLLGGVDNSAPSAASAANGDADSSRQSVSGEGRGGGRPSSVLLILPYPSAGLALGFPGCATLKLCCFKGGSARGRGGNVPLYPRGGT